MVEVPVPEARYEAIFALKNKLLLLSRPVRGSLDRVFWDSGPPPNGQLESYDLVEGQRETVLTEVADVVISGDRATLPSGPLARATRGDGASGWCPRRRSRMKTGPRSPPGAEVGSST